jgi:membrane protein DedA with SNARE-associated domain
VLENLREFFNNPLESLIYFLNNPTIALWGPFVGLLACGMGLPIPEDIILVVAGFLAGQNNTKVLPVIFITYAGIMLGDSLIFFIGQKLGRKVMKSNLAQKILTPERLEKAVEAFHKYGIWVNFFGRFLPGVRTAIFFTGGTLKYPFHRFFLMDGLAALISAPVFVSLGYWAGIKFSENISLLNHYIKKTKVYFSLSILLILIIVGIVFFIKAKKSKKKVSESK